MSRAFREEGYLTAVPVAAALAGRLWLHYAVHARRPTSPSFTTIYRA
jgi:hypothetical protein